MAIATITLLRASGCHFCADAQQALDELGGQYAIRVDLVEADSGQGLALIDTHQPAMFPLVLVDGAYFSDGRLPRRKLRALLDARAVPVTLPVVCPS